MPCFDQGNVSDTCIRGPCTQIKHTDTCWNARTQLAWTRFLHLEGLVKELLAEAESVLLERALPVTYPPEKAGRRAALAGEDG